MVIFYINFNYINVGSLWLKVTFHGSSSRTMAQEQNKFLKPSLMNIYSFVDKSVVCVVCTDVVIRCLSVNDINLLTVFMVKNQLLHWIITA